MNMYKDLGMYLSASQKGMNVYTTLKKSTENNSTTTVIPL